VEKMKALLQAEASASVEGLTNVPECGVAFSFSVFRKQKFHCRLFVSLAC